MLRSALLFTACFVVAALPGIMVSCLVGCSAALNNEDLKDIADHGAILNACETKAHHVHDQCAKACDAGSCQASCDDAALKAWDDCLRYHGIVK